MIEKITLFCIDCGKERVVQSISINRWRCIECREKKFEKFIKDNEEKIKEIAEKNTIRNESGQTVISEDDEWREDNEWNRYYDELEKDKITPNTIFEPTPIFTGQDAKKILEQLERKDGNKELYKRAKEVAKKFTTKKKKKTTEKIKEDDPNVYIKQSKRDAIIFKKNVKVRVSNGSRFVPEDNDEIETEKENTQRNDNELIQYYVVNSELNMSTGKIAAQVAHASMLIALDYQNDSRFINWKNNNMKKIILKGKHKDLIKLRDVGFYTVIDNGLTEVPEGSMTVVCSPVMTRTEARKHIGRLRLL